MADGDGVAVAGTHLVDIQPLGEARDGAPAQVALHRANRLFIQEEDHGAVAVVVLVP